MSDQPPSEASSGDRRYRLLEQIGRGGFGSVYRGRLITASGFEKEVAIKVLHLSTPTQGDFAARMRDEARMLALLRHRAIVGVEDLLTIGEQVAIVMELIEGADLASLLKLGPVPPRAAVEIAREAAWALAAAHSALDPSTGLPLQLVHRDIKPANIRVTPSGDVKVMDFGVARARFQDRESKTDSLSFGSWGYMAPERFDEQESPASDIYALGAVLFECISGARLKQLSVNPEKHRMALVRALHAVNVESAALLAILERMMSYEVSERPTALEAASTLRGLAPTLDGAWLNEWIPDVLGRLSAEAPNTVLLPSTGSDPSPRRTSTSGGRTPTPTLLLPASGAPTLTPVPSPEAGLLPQPDADLSGPCLSEPMVKDVLLARAADAPDAPDAPDTLPETSEAQDQAEQTSLDRAGRGATRVGIVFGALTVVFLGMVLLDGRVEQDAPTPTPAPTPTLTIAGATEPEGAREPALATAGPQEPTPAPKATEPIAVASAHPRSPPPTTARSDTTSARSDTTSASQPGAPEASPPPAAPETTPSTASAAVEVAAAAPSQARVATAPPEAATTSPGPALSGSWSGEALGRPLALRLSFDESGQVSGTTRARLGAEEVVRNVRGTFDAQTGALELTESGAREVTYTGRIANGRVSGQVLVAGRSRGDWTAQLQAP